MAADHELAEAVRRDRGRTRKDPGEDLGQRRPLDPDQDRERRDQVDGRPLGLEDGGLVLTRPAGGERRPDRQRCEEREERPVAARDDDPPAGEERSARERAESDRAEAPGPREVAARRDADDGDDERGGEARQGADEGPGRGSEAQRGERPSLHAATVHRADRNQRTISTGVPSGMMRASRRIVGFVLRMQPWLTSWPIAAASFVPCRPIRPSPPKPNVL